MMTSSDSGHAVAGGLARHIPVLIRPAVELLDVRAGGGYARQSAGGNLDSIVGQRNGLNLVQRERLPVENQGLHNSHTKTSLANAS